jgi:murein L,D-transpeptidase YcbB/YkuD
MGLAAPALAASDPQISGAAIQLAPAAAQAVNAFYASRGGAPLWLADGPNSVAANDLIAILERASFDGFPQGPEIAAQAQAMIAGAQGGDPAALNAADRLLSTAWIEYVQALQRPTPGMTYADYWVKPRRQGAMEILQRTAAAPILSTYLQSVSEVNPLYAQLRDAAWNQMQSGGSLDPRVLTSLDRAREMPLQHKYVMVDAAAARLYMIQDGRIVDSMRVAVGKPGESTQTPMLASTIYYATVNPYWHVSDELIRSLIAKNVLEQGLGYLKQQGYQVMPADESDNSILDPTSIDWHAVADGSLKVRVRELPGPRNSMGRVKFGFPNQYDIYLHDTPVKGVFASDDRTISHGCIRLEDAQRLEQWLMDGSEPDTTAAEQQVPLPSPVPIYVTYLTAQVHDGQLSYIDDIYGREHEATQVAALK